MAGSASAQLIGLNQLFRKLETMGKAGDKAADKALKASGKVFMKRMLGRVNTSSVHKASHLKNAIKVSPVKRDDDGEKYVSVGTYLGGGKYRNNVYWGHIVEGGHVLKSRSGKVIGYVSARPFVQPAYESGMDEAFEVASDIIAQALGL